MMRVRTLAPLLVLVVAALGCRRAGSVGPAAPSPVGGLAVDLAEQEINRLWEKGRADFSRGRWTKAAESFEKLTVSMPPGDERLPRLHFYLGECHFGKGDNLQAVREFRKVSDETPDADFAAEALLRAGDAYVELWRRPELDPTYGQTALVTYQELLNRYPGGSAALRAQRKIAMLQDRFAYKEYRAAMFYYRFKAYDSAILYLKDLVATYPRAAVVPDALVRLISAYRLLGYTEDVTDTCEYLRRYHPGAKGAAEACPAPAPPPATPAPSSAGPS